MRILPGFESGYWEQGNHTFSLRNERYSAIICQGQLVDVVSELCRQREELEWFGWSLRSWSGETKLLSRSQFGWFLVERSAEYSYKIKQLTLRAP